MKKLVILIVMICVVAVIGVAHKRNQISHMKAMTRVVADMKVVLLEAEKKSADSSDEFMMLETYVTGLKRIDTEGTPEDFRSDFKIYSDSFEAALDTSKLGQSVEEHDIRAEEAHARMAEALVRIVE